nr:hypothetical protein GCM10010200_096140 [Actinomadura rugatobispora]
MFAESIAPLHEYRHPPDRTPSYNESTYYNFTSPGSGVVGWLRIAVQPNRPAGQATALIFLPEGRTLLAFHRVEQTTADTLAVGPIAIEIDEPHRRQRLTFDGPVSVFPEPRVLSDPGPAFRAAPLVGARIDLTVTGNGDSFGTSGEDPANILERSMALGHYEQFIQLAGSLRVDGEEHQIQGGGLRDHSWGPRDWAGPRFYRWISASFDDGSAVMGLQVAQADGTMTRRAALASAGIATEARLGEVALEWTDDGFCRRISCALQGPDSESTLTGTARVPEQFVPLRHHRPQDGTSHGVTRIGYSAYDFELSDGRHGLGIVEVLDRMVDGLPISMTGQDS